MDRFEEQFGGECVDIKQQLSLLPNATSGRVLLADFHRGALEGKGIFRESADYLRAAGALDQSNPARPQVLLPNYVYSPSSFLDLCCPNDCDLIMEHLEQSLQRPEVGPSDVSRALTAPALSEKQVAL